MHPLTRQLLVTPDGVQMLVESEMIERATARALGQDTAVPELHIHHELGNGRMQRGAEQCADGGAAHGPVLLEQGDLLGGHVDFVHGRWPRTCHTETADLGQVVVAQRPATRLRDDPSPRLREGFAADTKQRSGDIQAVQPGRQTHAHRRAHGNVQVGRRALGFLLSQPARHYDRSAHRHVFGQRKGPPASPAHGHGVAGEDPALPKLAREPELALAEPALGRYPDPRMAEHTLHRG